MAQTVSEVAFIVVASTVLMLLMSGFIVFMVVMHRNRQLKNRQQVTEIKASYEQAILTSQLEIQEQTFEHVGRELHDNLGQMLSLVKLNLASPTEERVHDSRLLLTKALSDMRALSKNLNMHWAEGISLEGFVNGELKKIQKTGAIKTVLLENAPFDVEKTQEKVIIFRIIQECMHNVIKHSQATEMSVKLELKHGKRTIEITDNGIGFDQTMVKDGSGLRNIRHRASVMGASVQWENVAAGGTKVTVQL